MKIEEMVDEWARMKPKQRDLVVMVGMSMAIAAEGGADNVLPILELAAPGGVGPKIKQNWDKIDLPFKFGKEIT